LKITLPIKGLYKGIPIANLPEGYTGDCNNVRPRDVLEGRIRIGQRPGLDKWSTDQVGGADQPIVAMCTVSSVT